MPPSRRNTAGPGQFGRPRPAARWWVRKPAERRTYSPSHGPAPAAAGPVPEQPGPCQSSRARARAARPGARPWPAGEEGAFLLRCPPWLGIFGAGYRPGLSLVSSGRGLCLSYRLSEGSDRGPAVFEAPVLVIDAMVLTHIEPDQAE